MDILYFLLFAHLANYFALTLIPGASAASSHSVAEHGVGVPEALQRTRENPPQIHKLFLRRESLGAPERRKNEDEGAQRRESWKLLRRIGSSVRTLLPSSGKKKTSVVPKLPVVHVNPPNPYAAARLADPTPGLQNESKSHSTTAALLDTILNRPPSSEEPPESHNHSTDIERMSVYDNVPQTGSPQATVLRHPSSRLPSPDYSSQPLSTDFERVSIYDNVPQTGSPQATVPRHPSSRLFSPDYSTQRGFSVTSRPDASNVKEPANKGKPSDGVVRAMVSEREGGKQVRFYGITEETPESTASPSTDAGPLGEMKDGRLNFQPKRMNRPCIREVEILGPPMAPPFQKSGAEPSSVEEVKQAASLLADIGGDTPRGQALPEGLEEKAAREVKEMDELLEVLKDLESWDLAHQQRS